MQKYRHARPFVPALRASNPTLLFCLQGKRTALVMLVTVCGRAPQSSTGQRLTAAALKEGIDSLSSTWQRCSDSLVSISSEVIEVDAGCAFSDLRQVIAGGALRLLWKVPAMIRVSKAMLNADST